MIVRALVVAAALLVALPSLGQEAPSVEQIVRALRPAGADASPRLMMRGVRAESRPEPPKGSPPPTINLRVHFDFGSARLSTDTLIVLDNLGRALNDPALKPYRFLIAGHTDGMGSPEANLRISEARARAVADYLTRTHAIARERLLVQGFGATQLLDPADPANSLNRRVQVTTLGRISENQP